MLYLLFHIGHERYALEAKCVVEVTPLLELKKIPQAPPALAGFINYRGKPVPTIDLSQFALGQPAGDKLSTRIIIVNCRGESGESRLLGLIAEQTTEFLRKNREDFSSAGLGSTGRPFHGPVLMAPDGPIQLIEEESFLCLGMRNLAFELPVTASRDGGAPEHAST
jgi:chemotaxis-related protein WspB